MKNTIELTREQYKDLIELLYLGNWLANSTREPEEEIEKYISLEQDILSQAKNFGLEHLTDEEEDVTHIAQELELQIQQSGIIDEYDENAFWDELCERLAQRDFLRQHDEEILQTMDDTEKFQALLGIDDEYRGYFAENGLDKLTCL